MTYYTNVIAVGETLNSSISTTVMLVSGMEYMQYLKEALGDSLQTLYKSLL